MIKMRGVIQKLLTLGWEPAPYTPQNDNGFYLWKVFEISQARELSNFTDYIPKDDELIFVEYEIYPHLGITRYCIWSSDDLPSDVIYEEDDYDTVLELALEDRLFTYQRKGCKNCRHNKLRAIDTKTCRKGHFALFGFNCIDYEPDYEIGYQVTIYDILNEERGNENENN